MAEVAVVTDARTASAGEAVAVSFRGRPDTRFFGAPTCGQPSANASFRLSDRSLLLLTTAFDADRVRTVYKGPIAADDNVSSTDVIARAIAWLHQ